MIAITVSTNYSDILPLVLKNKRYFKHWIFVTSKSDSATQDILKELKDVTVLFYDFNLMGRRFDKGGAVRMAQHYAYQMFPQDWYLLIDSDIILGSNFTRVIKLDELDENTIYGAASRVNFKSLEDLTRVKNGFKHDIEGNQIWGFFQLYRRKIGYQPSDDASGCDIVFASQFLTRQQLPVQCFHLGEEGVNWQGRTLGADFKV